MYLWCANVDLGVSEEIQIVRLEVARQTENGPLEVEVENGIDKSMLEFTWRPGGTRASSHPKTAASPGTDGSERPTASAGLGETRIGQKSRDLSWRHKEMRPCLAWAIRGWIQFKDEINSSE